MKIPRDLSQKGLMNLVLLACAGYLVTAGIVGGALVNNRSDSAITASMPSQENAVKKSVPVGKNIPATGDAATTKPQGKDATKTDEAKVPAANKESGSSSLQTTEEPASQDSGSSFALLPKPDKEVLPSKDKVFKPRYDKKILEAATERAGEKIGGLRGSVDEDALFVVNKTPVEKRSAPPQIKSPSKAATAPVILQRPAWKPETDGKKPLPPIVFNEPGKGVDLMTTGSTGGIKEFKDLELRR